MPDIERLVEAAADQRVAGFLGVFDQTIDE